MSALGDVSSVLADDANEGNRPGPDRAKGVGAASSRHDVILVVDDDDSILEMVRDLLELEGYVVITARSGREALQLVEVHEPVLVLLDMRMPDGDGWEYASKSRERGLVAPIVVVTAAESARRWAHEIEAAGYISKPFDVTELISAVEHYRLRRDRRH